MRSELEVWLADPARLESVQGEERQILYRLAFAGLRGISAPPGPIETLARELMAFRVAEGDGWHGLQDWGERLREQWLEARPPVEAPPADRLPASRAWLEGVAALSARIDLGVGRLTRTGEINRRDRPRLRESFFHLADCGVEAQEECLDLTLSFFSQRELVLVRDGRLECHPDLLGMLDDPREIVDQVRLWWLRKVFGGGRQWWEYVSGRFMSGADAATIWGWREDAEHEGKDTKWTSLPVRLRQAIALGLLDARTESGAISVVGPAGEDLPAPDRPATATADLLVYLAPMAPPRMRRGLEAISVRESAGLVGRYRLTRDTVLEAAANPILGEELGALLDSMDPPPVVRRVVQEWLEARRTCQFENVRVLRVRDPLRQTELAALPSVASLVEEAIPGWGFLVDPAREAELRVVLQSLGYDPPDPSGRDRSILPWTSPFSLESDAELSQEWILDLPAEEPRRSAISSSSKYGEGLKELPFQDMLRVIEYAILTDSDIEVVLKGGSQKPQRLRVLRIDKRREPVTLEIKGSVGREEREVALETVRKIRVCD
jgi:hypothetical protein